MTSRSKNAARGYETEIEKCREEGNWKKAIELAHQLKARSPQHESLAHFLIGEGKLEDYLEEHPPVKEHMQLAQSQLGEARGYLSLATDEAGKKAGVALDAHLLLGKLNYACGSYDEALKHFRLAELHTLTEKELSLRSLRIVAESYAIKGLCLEETGVPAPSSKYKLAEYEAELSRSVEVSSALALQYLQRAPAAAAAPAAAPAAAAALLQAALRATPRPQDPKRALLRYREMLSAVECQWTQALRLTLSRQLAELLMRGTVAACYEPPQKTSLTSQQGTLTRRSEDGSNGPWKPKKYSGINQFVPSSLVEECALAVVVGEALAVRGAVLSQSAEFQRARTDSLAHAAALQDLLAIFTARHKLLPLLLESLDRAMKFSFGSAHVWRQRALACAALAPPRARPPVSSAAPAEGVSSSGGGAGGAEGVKAMAVVRHARSLSPHDVPLRLVGAQTCYTMSEIEDGLKLAEEALAIEEKNEGPMLSRCHLYVGIGYQMMAQRCGRTSGATHMERSSRHLLTAARSDPRDARALYQLSAHYLARHMRSEALEAARASLQAAESAPALRVLVALSATAPAALAVCALARDHYPHAVWPLAARALPALHWEGQESALATAKELLTVLNTSPEPEMEQVGYCDLDALSNSQHDHLSNGDAASLLAESTGASRVERALSESAEGSPRPRQTRKAQAWLLVAEMCLRIGRTSAAAGCVAEAAALTPCSHLVLYTRGLVHEASGDWEEARDCFRNAVALHPTHLDSLVHLGTSYYETGWLGLAESTLVSGAALDPTRAGCWRRLARVLAARGDHAAAADADAAALALLDDPPVTQQHV